MGLTRKRCQSTPFKQELAEGMKTSPGDQALAVKGQPRRPNGSRGNGKPRKRQGPSHGDDEDRDTSSQPSITPPNGIGGYGDVALSHLSKDDDESVEGLFGQVLLQARGKRVHDI